MFRLEKTKEKKQMGDSELYFYKGDGEATYIGLKNSSKIIFI